MIRRNASKILFAISRMLIHTVYVAAVLAMIVRVNDGRTIEVNWTTAGVENYRELR